MEAQQLFTSGRYLQDFYKNVTIASMLSCKIQLRLNWWQKNISKGLLHLWKMLLTHCSFHCIASKPKIESCICLPVSCRQGCIISNFPGGRKTPDPHYFSLVVMCGIFLIKGSNQFVVAKCYRLIDWQVAKSSCPMFNLQDLVRDVIFSSNEVLILMIREVVSCIWEPKPAHINVKTKKYCETEIKGA